MDITSRIADIRSDLNRVYSKPMYLACTEVQDYTQVLSQREFSIVEKAVAKRKNEYSTGRMLAHKLLQEQAFENYEILRGSQREPVWPVGVVGSIAHTDGHAITAIARGCDFESIGIDLETQGRVGEKLISRLITDLELRENPQIDPTLIFSAKEALYKYLFPLVKMYVDFLDVDLDIRPSTNDIFIRAIKVPAANTYTERLRGRYYEFEGMWLCCFAS